MLPFRFDLRAVFAGATLSALSIVAVSLVAGAILRGPSAQAQTTGAAAACDRWQGDIPGPLWRCADDGVQPLAIAAAVASVAAMLFVGGCYRPRARFAPRRDD